MSNQFLKYARDNAPSTTLSVPEEVTSLVPVSNISGQQLMVPAFQLPTVNPNDANYQIYRFENQSSGISNALQAVTKFPIQVLRKQGSGKTIGRVFLRMVINNTNASHFSAYTIPAPFMIGLIEFKNSTGQTISQWRGEDIWKANMTTKDQDSWNAYGSNILSSPNYDQGRPLYYGSTEIHIELTGNPYSVGELLTPHLRADQNVWVTTSLYSNWLLPGPLSKTALYTDLSLTDCSLDFEMENADPKKFDRELKYAQSIPKTFYYPYPVWQEFTATLNASTQYTWQLSSFKGSVVALWMNIKNSSAGEDQFNYVRNSSLQIQNSDGRSITGQNLVTDRVNRLVQNKEWWLGGWMKQPSNNLYTWVFGKKKSSAVAFLTLGQVNGSFAMDTHQQLVWNTPSAGTNEQWTLTPSSATVIAQGSAQFKWTTPDGETGISFPFLYSESTANLETILQATPFFRGQCTFSTALDTGAAVTLTFGPSGSYANQPMFSEGYCLEIVNSTFATATPFLPVSFEIDPTTTLGVLGLTSGNSYTVELTALTVGMAQQTREGDIIVMSSSG